MRWDFNAAGRHCGYVVAEMVGKPIDLTKPDTFRRFGRGPPDIAFDVAEVFFRLAVSSGTTPKVLPQVDS